MCINIKILYVCVISTSAAVLRLVAIPSDVAPGRTHLTRQVGELVELEGLLGGVVLADDLHGVPLHLRASLAQEEVLCRPAFAELCITTGQPQGHKGVGRAKAKAYAWPVCAWEGGIEARDEAIG